MKKGKTKSSMTSDKQIVAPEHTAVRVALWRALHVQIDPKPHVLTDEIGLKLVAEDGWRSRPDMSPDFSKGMRASIVGRARFIEDLVEEQAKQGATQYVILGAGLDTFAQRRPEIASHLRVFEVDQPGPQSWKRKRLTEIGFAAPEWLHFVPVDFEAGQSWWEQLIACGFDARKPAVVVSTGVSMYLTKEANLGAFRQMAKLAPGSTFAMTFMLALDLLRYPGKVCHGVCDEEGKRVRNAFPQSLFSGRDIGDGERGWIQEVAIHFWQ
jgi:methyltransferase (TIGR00027 family)